MLSRRRRRRAWRWAPRRSTPKRMEVWCAQIKFAFRVDVPGVYGMPDSSGVPDSAPCLQKCAHTSAHRRVRRYALVQTPALLRMPLQERATEVLQTPKLYFFHPFSLPSTLGVANSRYSLSLSLSLLHHILSASPTVSSSLVRQHFLFLPAHILHSDLVFFSSFCPRVHCLF